MKCGGLVPHVEYVGGSCDTDDRYGGSCDPNVKYGPGSGTESGPGTTPSNDVLSIGPANYGGSSPPSTVADPDVKYGGSLSEGSRTLSITAKQVPHNFGYWAVRHAERMMNAIPGKYKGTLVSTLD